MDNAQQHHMPRVPTFTFLDENGVSRSHALDAFLPAIGAAAERFRSLGAPGDIIGIVSKSDPTLVVAWFAALHAGFKPLIMQYPTKKQSRQYWLDSVSNTIDKTGLAGVVCDAYSASLGIAERTRAIEIGPEILDGGDAATPTPASLLPPAFSIVQLSSGTTGHRKAVEFTSVDLVRHAADYNDALKLVPGADVIASWLPLYHDMGYVACFVMPIILGVDVVMIDPMTWVQSPDLLYTAIEKHSGTVAYMPNFGFEVMARSAPRRLPTMRRWISCSEPVSAQTSHKFIKHIGASESAFSACYAMAENIFAVSLSEGVKTAEIDGGLVTSCGAPIPGVEIKTVDGELWVKSPTSLRAYLGAEDIRDADGFYPTGDLGQIIDGEIYVSGRKQDLIIQAGRKFMLSDIDLAVNDAFPDVRGRVAAVQAFDERLGTQKPLIIIETPDFYARRDHDAIAVAIRDKTGLDQVEIAFAPPRFLTKTSSGKINRKKSAADWLAHKNRLAEGGPRQASVEAELKHSFAHVDWKKPVGEILDSLSLTVLRIILNDGAIPFDRKSSLDDFLTASRAKEGDAAPDAKHLYIVSIADSGTIKRITEDHLQALASKLGVPVVFEHVCMPPSPIVLSDLIFQDYFLPRVDREPYSVVERCLDKLRAASIILTDDVAEMQFPPAQVYGALSHTLERDPRADLITVRWQRYAQQHHLLPLTVVAGCDLRLRDRTAVIDSIAAYLQKPVFRIAGLADLQSMTEGWEHRLFEGREVEEGDRLYVEPDAFVQAIGAYIENRRDRISLRSGAMPTGVERSDLAHFCSRICDKANIDAVISYYDRFCIVGNESSVPYLAKRIAEESKSFVRAPSYAPEALQALDDQFDCLLICGPQGRYEIRKPAVALMAADPKTWTWNIDEPDIPKSNFVVRSGAAPESGVDWYYAHPFDRRNDREIIQRYRARAADFHRKRHAELRRRRALRRRRDVEATRSSS